MSFREISIRTKICGLVLSGALGLLPVLANADPSTTATSDPAFQQAVEQVVEQYLRSHPEVIEQSLLILQAQRKEEERERVRSLIAIKQAELMNDPHSPVSGNLEGDVTVVEFFDYQCGYCKRVAGTVTQLQHDDPNVRVVYKDYPILGEASVLAARAALASKAQGKHVVFHEALLATEEELTQETILALAATVGLDTEKLHRDMESPSIQTAIERNRALARELGINGTPGFIIGTELVPGALELKDLKVLVSRVRQDRS
ncbi:MAG: DsbA family protein [Nitrospirota bacterium]|nr:DsbA family protein [Nitrospirota bacterium]